MMNSKILTAVLVVAVIIASFWLGTVWQGPAAPSGKPAAGVSVAGSEPFLGGEDAKLTILEYSDFQCPYCSKVVPTVHQIAEAYGDTVKIVFRNFPLSFHQFAQKAAEASECANVQGKFWEMHDKLFANNGALTVPDLKLYAGQLGLDQAKFDACLDNGDMAAEVTKDFEAGTSSGVQGTPAFIIGGEQISGAQPFDAFKAIIDKKLAEV